MGRTACTEPQCLYKGALYLDLYTQARTFERIRFNLVHSFPSYRRLVLHHESKLKYSCCLIGLVMGSFGIAADTAVYIPCVELFWFWSYRLSSGLMLWWYLFRQNKVYVL